MKIYTKCSTYYNVYVDSGVKIRDHCHITGKYRGSAQRDYNIKIKLNQSSKNSPGIQLLC